MMTEEEEWELPPTPPGWEALWSDEYEAYYYHNAATGETSWEEPEEPEEHDGPERARSNKFAEGRRARRPMNRAKPTRAIEKRRKQRSDEGDGRRAGKQRVQQFSLRTMVTVLVTPLLFAGVFLILGPGLEILPSSEEERTKMEAMFAIWMRLALDSGLNLPAVAVSEARSGFFIFVGGYKVLGVLGLWGVFGQRLSTVATVCFIPHLCATVYTHKQLGLDASPAGP